MRKHGSLGVSSGSRCIAKHVNVIGLWLELVQFDVLVFSSMFDDLIDMHNGQSGILTISLNRIVVIIHRYEELDAIGLALVFKDDQLAQLCRSTSYSSQLSLLDDELDGSWSECVIECNSGTTERS